ncbi:hypothetical protein BN873_p10017 [Candidatus Competibacter denitrificans Run_A_D11]|uniref:Uncharacterized protein n=1 Tax=Candidatus Competibacter denitrificans Run_A_D11 TaxID=1400863 RepID=W6MEG5_9GAMM|nr:hypothetical protein [Candidatus Competibacter denitrificans]CDI04573.1 hypothetical protein BN873_p10017 [Candidatus Competibacter denitrificans Run_A_D11]
MDLSGLSPAFKAVMEIAHHAGSGMTVQQSRSIPFPTGVCQVWEFKPALPPLEREPVVVGVLLQGRGIARWTPLNMTFGEAVAHYERLATPRRAAAEAESAPIHTAPPVSNAPTTAQWPVAGPPPVSRFAGHRCTATP